jgi:hypothetical protein
VISREPHDLDAVQLRSAIGRVVSRSVDVHSTSGSSFDRRVASAISSSFGKRLAQVGDTTLVMDFNRAASQLPLWRVATRSLVSSELMTLDLPIRQSRTVLAQVRDLQWGDVATWVASIGTVSAVIVALVQVARERNARLAREVQDRADRHICHASLISAWLGPAQAVPESRRVNCGVELDAAYNCRTPIYVHNSSAEPIYEVVTGVVFIQGGGAPRTLEGMLDLRNHHRQEAAKLAENGIDVSKDPSYRRDPITTIGIVPPGTWRVWIQGKGWTSILSGRGGADIAFVDRAEVSWVRRAMGPLEELSVRPLEHFTQHGLFGPYEFQVPESADAPHQVGGKLH